MSRNFLIAVFVSLAFGSLSCGHGFAAEQPNIVLIVTDDQSPMSLSVYGNKVCDTPNIDRLAAEGMTLDRAYHMGSMSGAVCTPSRHMIMTGRTLWHLPNNGKRVKRTKKGREQLSKTDAANFSMPAVFNGADYVTFRTCKRGNSYDDANQLFQIRHEASKRGGTAESGSQWHADRVVDFLAARKTDKSKPFLMYFGFSHPHDTRDGTPELLEKYGAKNAKQPPTSVNVAAPPLPTNYLPEHPFHHGQPGLRDEEKVSGVLTSRTEATIRNEQGREYACIENIDRQIGRMLDGLEAAGELESTYVIFTSDHGIAIGRHGLMGKQNLYEHSWRVPMIVRGPGIQAGSRAAGNVYLLDLLPTICDLSGVSQPDTIQGQSFKPVLIGDKSEVREVLYGAYCGGTKPGMRAVRSGDWKLIKYDVLDGTVRETQLFNLKENPHEFIAEHHAADVVALTGVKPEPHQTDLAEDPKYAEKRNEMEALLLSQQQQLNDPYRFWDQPPAK